MRSRRLEILLTPGEGAAWDEEAAAAGLTRGAYVRRCVNEVIAVRRAVERADREADRRAERLGRLTPAELARRRRRGLPDYPLEDER